MPYFPTLPSSGDTSWAGPLNAAITGVNAYVATVESIANGASSSAGSALSIANNASSAAANALGKANAAYVKPGTGIPLADLQQSLQDLINAGGGGGGGGYIKPSTGIPATDLASAVQSQLTLANTAYQRPANGITTADLAPSIVTSLGKADGAYVKPGSGIPAGDLATGIVSSLGKADSAYQRPANGITTTDLASSVTTSLGRADTAYQLPATGIPMSTLAQGVQDAISSAGGGGYVKPSSGIPSTDLATAVQTSLGLANTALQSAPVTTVAGRTGAITLAKSDVGLPNVDNTADTAKPVSTAQQTALNLKANLAGPTFTGTVSGITAAMVGLGNVTNVTPANLPISTATQTALNTKYTFPAGGVPSTDMTSAVQASLGLANSALQSAPVSSVAGRTGAITLTSSDVGLSNVSNVSPANLPISSATQTALNAKYTFPTGGIPMADLATAVQNAISAGGSGGGAVSSVAGKTGTVILSPADVQLGNVNNTADIDKPVSSATQTALNGKSSVTLLAQGATSVPAGSPTGLYFFQ